MGWPCKIHILVLGTKTEGGRKRQQGRELKGHSPELRTKFGCDLEQSPGWVSSLVCKGGEQLGEEAKQLCRASQEQLKSSSMKIGVFSIPCWLKMPRGFYQSEI